MCPGCYCPSSRHAHHETASFPHRPRDRESDPHHTHAIHSQPSGTERDQHGDYHWVPVVLWFQYKCYDLIWNCVVWYEIAGSQVPSLLDLKELNRNLRWLAVAVVLTWTFCISLGQDSGRGAAAAPNIWERWNFNSISILSLNKMYYFESYNIRQLHKLSNL